MVNSYGKNVKVRIWNSVFLALVSEPRPRAGTSFSHLSHKEDELDPVFLKVFP